MAALSWHFEIETWPFVTPYRWAGGVWTSLDFLIATVSDDGSTGVGEGAGVYYHDEPPATMLAMAEGIRSPLEAGIQRDELQQLLPPSGARNAIDCALWDLEAKQSGRPAWETAGFEVLRPLTCIQTLSIGTPKQMAADGAALPDVLALKLKIAGDGHDGERVLAVRDARPECWIGIDANQSLTPAALDALLPALVEARIDLLEQPFPVGEEAALDGLGSPIPIAADESVQTSQDLEALCGRFDIVNIKLDKAGGLTEALAMLRGCERLGLRTMVGNMLGTSRAMAPGLVLGQHCDVVDLDGPLLIGRDIAAGLTYADGMVALGACRWGTP